MSIGEVPDDDRNWAARVVLEIAGPLLDSQEIRQALDQVQLGIDDISAVLGDRAGDLICSAAGNTWSFIAYLDWDWILPWGRPPWLTPAALVASGVSVVTLITFYGWATTVGILLLLAYLAVLGLWFVSGRPSLREPIRPTAQTSDSLRRRVIGPFLREHLNQLLDEQDQPVQLRVTTAPGLAELSEREQIDGQPRRLRTARCGQDDAVAEFLRCHAGMAG